MGDVALRLALRLSKQRTAQRRHDLLGALGPLLLVLEATAWFFALIAGFALAMYAYPQGFAPSLTLLDAVYASASSFLTLGLTGHGARTAWSRGLVIGAALCGFGLVPLVVTFLLNIQGALTQREQLVLRVGERDRKPPTGLGILHRHARLGPDRREALGRFFEEWDAWSAQVLLTHRAFPVLAYFRSTDPECDWLAGLSAVLDAAALLATLEQDAASEPAILFHRMGSRLARDLAAIFRCDTQAAVDITQERFDDACLLLAQAGFGRAAESSATYVSFAKMREQYEPAIAGLCQRFGVPRASW